MCDYSLQGIPNRLAVKGEELLTHRFPTGSVGMASSEEIIARVCRAQQQQSCRKRPWAAFKLWLYGADVEPVRAVCIPPGTNLRMTRIPDDLKRQLGLNAVEDVTFTQLHAEAFQYRDAIRFRNGRHLLLQSFREDVLFQVLSEISDDSPRGKPVRGENSAAALQHQPR
jgi:hypothetical protein